MGQIPNLEKLMAFCWLVIAPLDVYKRQDLYLYQNEDYRSQVRLRWGQDFYRRKTTETGKEDSNE